MATKEKEGAPLDGDAVKLKTLCEVITVLAPLDRVARLSVLRAAANYYDIALVTELPR